MSMVDLSTLYKFGMELENKWKCSVSYYLILESITWCYIRFVITIDEKP